MLSITTVFRWGRLIWSGEQITPGIRSAILLYLLSFYLLKAEVIESRLNDAGKQCEFYVHYENFNRRSCFFSESSSWNT